MIRIAAAFTCYAAAFACYWFATQFLPATGWAVSDAHWFGVGLLVIGTVAKLAGHSAVLGTSRYNR